MKGDVVNAGSKVFIIYGTATTSMSIVVLESVKGRPVQRVYNAYSDLPINEYNALVNARRNRSRYVSK